MQKLNVLEIYYGIFREDGEHKAEEALTTILALPITVIELNSFYSWIHIVLLLE